MLQLKNIVKNYRAGDTTIAALRGIDLTFRENDFVAVLGQSGCGKTTMLNIIGGLDRYTSGDLVINGVSTKEYRDADWDIYRNNKIGFVFQSYNLIPHQTVLANVELAMTLAGVSRDERRKRAADALNKVGLGDQLNKKPLQMSGGQMQRVAIARALVNNPDILLADEPTGALDSETSVQIMDILKEVAKERLVIMVTHNGDLAEKYATRVIRLLDGRVISDTNPLDAADEKAGKKKRKKVSMSLPTALSLSFRNLLTKKTRTILTAFAGSIGIIGIALILSLSSGMNAYIGNLERDTLSTYPLQIQSQTADMSSMISSMMLLNNTDGDSHDKDGVYSNNIVNKMMSSMATSRSKNDLKRFKEHIESAEGAGFYDATNSIKYGYNIDLQIYASDTSKVTKLNPSSLFSGMTPGGDSMAAQSPMGSMGMGMGSGIWDELIDNRDLLKEQYELAAGNWPEAYDEIILVVDGNNEISDYALYSLGLLDSGEVDEMLKEIMKGDKVSTREVSKFSYDEILSTTFKLLPGADQYALENGVWTDKSGDDAYMRAKLGEAVTLKITGIIRPKEETNAAVINGSVGYSAALTEYVINAVNGSAIVREQVANPDRNVFTGMPFEADEMTMEDVRAYMASMPEEQQKMMEGLFSAMPDEQILAMMRQQAQSGEAASYEGNAETLGIIDFDNPDSISLYPKDFDSKERIAALIKAYNDKETAAGNDEYVINYTDIVGMMTSSISSIINITSYVLIAFVAISLVVSSIMIAIITYISVLERTKEIGILRSIGASKGDISRLFNAETIIEGFVAGVLGVAVTLLLNIPINMIIKSLVGISGIAVLPLYGVVGLIVISVALTLIAGFIPAKMAAKKDPVEALRSE